MKTQDNLEKQLGNIKETELTSLYFIQKIVEELIELGKIDENGLRSLENAERELVTLRSRYAWNMINILKKGQMV